MRNVFATTANVERFQAAITRVEGRGAAEAGWMAVSGKAGFGKSETLQWHATQRAAPMVRAKAGWTPHWMLTDLVVALGHRPMRSSHDLFNQALGAIAASLNGEPPPLIIDEIDHALRDVKVLETVRDLSDLTEIVVIVAGHEGLEAGLRRFPQIHSRVAEFVEFGPASAADVRRIVEARCEVAVDGEIIDKVLKESGGRPRLILNAIAQIERLGKRNAGEIVEIGDLPTEPLVLDPQAAARRRAA